MIDVCTGRELPDLRLAANWYSANNGEGRAALLELQDDLADAERVAGLGV
jgi:hypothetical protein